MRLKRLELFGFKSFADRVSLDFRHDLVGIVGPNGCGKSNVVDAVRWVLGEQRPTSMRGGEMADVIFKGSASRPALSVAEVTLVLDNARGILPDRGAEVSITRRVYRGGEGEYLLDNERVRLKDVREMLFGTGLGSRGYSVLEQGRIDAVLSADPLERRSIFEEAAGISRYRQRKKETEAKCLRVEADLARLSDVIGELDKHQRSLKTQAARARRFLELRESWRTEGLRLARHQLERLRSESAEAEAALRAREAEVAGHRARRNSAEEEVRGREGEIAAFAAEIERLGTLASDLAADLRGNDERRAALAANAEAARRASEQEHARASELAQRIETRRAEAEILESELAALERSLSETREGVRVLSAQAAELFAAFHQASEKSERKNEELLRCFHELTSEKSRLEHLEQSLEPLSEREHRSEERLEEVRCELREAREEREREELRSRTLAEHLVFHERIRAERSAEVGEAAATIQALELRRGELGLECARHQSRIDSLRDWEREREGLDAGAQELLRFVERGEGPLLERELGGLLADHLRTTSRHARALDAALGELSQAFVLSQLEGARNVLAWLKERSRGRVTLVLRRESSGADLPDPGGSLQGVLSEEGVEGRLLDVVRVPSEFEALAARVLGKVVVVRDAARALELVERYPHVIFVTSDGDRVDAASVRGGHVEIAQGAVGRRSIADELADKRTVLEGELERVRAELEGRREQRSLIAHQLEEARATLEQLGAERAQVEAQAEGLGARIQDLERRMVEAERECEGLAHERDGIDDEAFALRERLKELEDEHSAARSALSELEAERRALDAERNQRSRDEGQARAELSGLSERKDALERRKQDLRRMESELLLELERSRRGSEQHQSAAREADVEFASLSEERDRTLERRGELEERVAALKAREGASRERLSELRKRGEALTAELEGCLERLAQGRLEHQRLELGREEILRRAEQDFGLEPFRIMEGFVPEAEWMLPDALQKLEARVQQHKSGLERLGPVNLEAVQELDAVSSRLDFLMEQKNDLEEAKHALEGTISRLNEESERRFLQAFEAIREEFHALFRQLFGGGRAELTLLSDGNVLESGIEITARPPGRESLPITLLSGGQRTLTALALLFAVFRANPSPFCILDEVDAALDDANIGRFLSLLDSSLGSTQYIVVTHNKGTMAACQMLYGITMAVRGVSHLVSVELDEVDDFVPRARSATSGSVQEATEAGEPIAALVHRSG